MVGITEKWGNSMSEQSIDVNLVLLNPNKYGGTITYTAHLYHGLKLAGYNPMIYRVGKKLGNIKDFGYGCEQRNAPVEYIAQLSGHTLVAACIGKEYEGPTRYLLGQGAFITIHDPNDLGNFSSTEWTDSRRIIIIRKNNTRICPNATFIPHPFVRHLDGFTFTYPRLKLAVTLSRLGAIKRTKWIVEANRRLKAKSQIWLRGYDDRFFTFNAFIRPRADGSRKYPEFKQDSELPDHLKMTFGKEMGTAQEIASQATYLVDLTEIKGDGGGTQYTLLEAMDAGCCLILNRAWVTPDGIWKPDVNCLAVGSSDELIDCLETERSESEIRSMVRKSYNIMVNHDARKIAEQYINTFNQNQ